MKCPKCDGFGYGIVFWGGWRSRYYLAAIDEHSRETYTPHVPCPDCYGTGEVSCCGDLGLPEPEQETGDEKEAPR